MARITHPQPELGTTRPQVGGVVFRDGIADVDLIDKPILREFYVQHGYGIDETEDLEALTVTELREEAEGRGAQVKPRARKGEIVEAIEERQEELDATLAPLADGARALPEYDPENPGPHEVEATGVEMVEVASLDED